MELVFGFLKIYGITILRYVVFAGVPFFLCYHFFKQSFKRSQIQQRLHNKKQYVNEIIHSLQSSVVIALVGMLFVYSPLNKYTLMYKNLHDYPLWWVPLNVLLALIVHDTYFYWMHRLLHHKKIFKYTHLVHHQSTNPSPWASYSFHILEAFTEALILPILLFTMPMHILSIFLFTLSSFIINVYGHLGFEITPKWFRNSVLFKVLNTSVYHNMHHHYFKGNYGLYFRFWDRLLKTEHPNYVKDYDALQQQRFPN